MKYKGDVFMKFCPNCGKGLTEQLAFCPECGKSLSVVSDLPIVPPALPPVAPPAKLSVPAINLPKGLVVPPIKFWIVAIALIILVIMSFQTWMIAHSSHPRIEDFDFNIYSYTFNILELIRIAGVGEFVETFGEEATGIFLGLILVFLGLMLSFLLLIMSLVKHKTQRFLEFAGMGFVFCLVSVGVFIGFIWIEGIPENPSDMSGIAMLTPFPYLMFVTAFVALILVVVYSKKPQAKSSR
jgi:hypothetical protein